MKSAGSFKTMMTGEEIPALHAPVSPNSLDDLMTLAVRYAFLVDNLNDLLRIQ